MEVEDSDMQAGGRRPRTPSRLNGYTRTHVAPRARFVRRSATVCVSYQYQQLACSVKIYDPQVSCVHTI
jgi:hypothetical protein